MALHCFVIRRGWKSANPACWSSSNLGDSSSDSVVDDDGADVAVVVVVAVDALLL